MTLTTIKKDKNNSFLLSEQVKKILLEKGYLKIFNYAEYHHYKKNVKDVFNKAFTIAELFILDNEDTINSDLNDYIF